MNGQGCSIPGPESMCLWTKGCMNEWMNEWINGPKDEWMNELMNEWMNE